MKKLQQYLTKITWHKLKLYIQLFRYSNAYADWMSIAMVAVCRRSTVTNPGKITLFSSRRNRIIMLISIRIYSLSLLIPTNFGVSSVLTSLFQFPFGFNFFWAGVSSSKFIFLDSWRIWNQSKVRNLLFETNRNL